MNTYGEQRSLRIKEKDGIFHAMDLTDDIASSMGFLQSDKLFLRLVTEEACMNSYEYCEKTNQDGFTICWEINDDCLTISLKHKGEEFSLTTTNDEVNSSLRGRGLQLIGSLMDEIRLNQDGEYIQFIMRKYLKH